MTAEPHGAIPEFTQGDRLRKARELTGLTAQEFADEIGVSRGTITNAETDARHVRPITIRAVQQLLGHASLATTQVYLGTRPESLRKALNCAA